MAARTFSGSKALRCHPASRASQSSRLQRCRARESDRERANRARDDQLRRQNALNKTDNLPDKGYFKQADTKAPLYKPFAGMGTGDVTKRSGNRWESDFIWNTKWQARMDYEEDTAKEQKKRQERQEEQSSGFLSISRVHELNSLDVDLSSQLSRPPTSSAKPIPIIQMIPVQPGSGENTASHAEEKRYKRANSFIKRYERSASEGQPTNEEMLIKAAAEKNRYEELKREYSLWTTGVAAACFAAAYTLYTREVAASYLIGALGGIAYLRLLNRSVDSFAGSTGGQVATATLTQPRLLIPMILVLIFNRYNFLYADSFDLHLQLLPMLLGFFTYKAGVLSQGAVSLFREMTNTEEKPVQPESSSEDASAGEKPDSSMTAVDRAFSQRILSR